MTYENDIEATLANVYVDEMGDYNYSAVISGNTLTFTDADYSNTNGVYMLTFFDKDDVVVTEDIYDSNELLTVAFKVNFSDGSESKVFTYKPVKPTAEDSNTIEYYTGEANLSFTMTEDMETNGYGYVYEVEGTINITNVEEVKEAKFVNINVNYGTEDWCTLSVNITNTEGNTYTVSGTTVSSSKIESVDSFGSIQTMDANAYQIDVANIENVTINATIN